VGYPDSEMNYQNPWKDRAGLATVSSPYAFGSALVFFLCALGLTVCGYEIATFGILAVTVPYLFWVARRPSSSVGILVTAALLSTLGSSLTVGAVFLALVVGCMSGAFLLTTRRIPIPLTLLIPLVAVGVAFAITRNVGISLLALSFTPAAALLAYATVSDRPRTSTIVFCTGGLLLSVAVAVAAAIWTTTGGLSHGCVVQFVDTVRESIIGYLLGQRDLLLGLLAEQPEAGSAELSAQINQLLSTDAVRQTVEEFFNILPALVAIAALLVAFFAQIMLTVSYGTVGLEKAITLRARMLTVSVTAAVIFSGCFLLALLLPNSLAMAVVLNLSIMLMPIFFLCGIQSLLAFARSSPGAKFFLLFIVGALFCCYSGGMLYLIAIFGAYSRISAAIRRKLASHAEGDR